MPSIPMSLIDIFLLVFFAIVLGITFHFFLTSRRTMRSKLSNSKKDDLQANEWKLKYFNETEVRDKELSSLREQLRDAEENKNIFAIEADELRKLNKKLQAELEHVRKSIVPPSNEPSEKFDYFQQLREAQASLMDHNEKINQLLSNIDIIKETEEKQQEILRDNEELYNQLENLRSELLQKESEISNIQQKAHLSREMSSMLDNAYTEFNTLQEKMQKLESQVSYSKMVNLQYEDLKEEHFKLKRDFDEQKVRLNAFQSENKELLEQLVDTEDRLKEANFQRQQLQKRVGYLEELNNDLQSVSDANKRLETQIKRIGELESMLNMMSEEREKLIKKQA